MLCFRQTTIEAMYSHARETFPDECCGFVLTDGEQETVRRITNVQNQMRALDEANFPRGATDGYYMDPKQLLAVERETASGAQRIKAVYHSHPNCEAYFSAEDRKQAMFGDEPARPGASYVVVSIYDREVRAMRAFEWDEEAHDFVETHIGPPQRNAKPNDEKLG